VSRRTRIYSLTALALVVTLAIGAFAMMRPFSSHAAAAGGSGLSKHGRALLATAVANGEKTITLLIAAKKGANKTVANGIAGLGGAVRYREDEVDYLRAVVPTAKAQAAAQLDGVQAVDVDELIPLEDPREGLDGATGVTPQPAPGAGTPRNNPYLPIGDTGAAQFVVANPTWDGRGVVIGIVDTGVDLHHPSLQTTSTGERKIIDWVTGTNPDEGDPTWIDMATQVSVSGGAVTVGGTTYTGIGANGAYRFGVFHEADLGAGSEYDPAFFGLPGCGADVNRNGVCGQTFAVLWRTSDNNVWVDANADSSFAGEPAMTDYRVNFDIGSFGSDNSATAVREAVPFVVQTDGKNKFVNIGIVAGAHGSHVSGIMAGHSLFGGAMSGAAPGAQIKSLRACLFVAGCTAHALLEGMTFMAKQENVDVINMSIGGLPALNDGNNARALVYNRLIEQYNVQLFISAGNSGAGVNTVGDPSVATDVVSVGAYISRDTWQKNYGSDSPYADNLHPFSSRGPREDGGFKPQVVAPGAAISTVPDWQVGQPVGGTYPLPPGYGMFNGTSMAAPQTTGAAALLVSAAKQVGVQHQPAQLRQALVSSARLLNAAQIPVYEQGNGLIDVGAAWDLLKTTIKPVGITSSVPVHTVLGGFLATPGVGVGIYDREGVTAGAAYTRTYTFTRTSGSPAAITYTLSWVGNDGTFSSAGSISLARNAPATLVVSVNAATTGAHSAILNLDDPSTAGVDYQTMNVVIAAEQFTAGNSYAVTTSGQVGRNNTLHYFFRVPAGTPAFKVDLSGPSTAAGTGQVRFLRFHPFGVAIDSNLSTANYCPSATNPAICPASALSRTTSNPQAGVWEVTVEARRTSDVSLANFTLKASILGASVSPNPDLLTASVPSTTARSYTLSSLFATFTGRAAGSTLGSARRGVFSIANLAQQTYPVSVTPGSTSLRATIGGPSDPAADLDLYVFNCTTGSCVLAGQSADGDAEESVTIANPAAGDWLVLIDGFAVPAGTTTYNYVDVFTNPAFGSVGVTDANAVRTTGGSWTVPGTVTVSAAPGAGRVLLGTVNVLTDTNILVGQGDVVVTVP
jgi:hypothetical protein